MAIRCKMLKDYTKKDYPFPNCTMYLRKDEVYEIESEDFVRELIEKEVGITWPYDAKL